MSQDVPILDYRVNDLGQVELEIEGSADEYYLLSVLHEPEMTYESITSMTVGTNGRMIVSEPLNAFGQQSYTITAYPISDPADTDTDGLDDISEFNNMPTQAPLNFADPVSFNDGVNSVDDMETFSELAVVGDDIPWAPFLNDRLFMKFAIVNQDSDKPEIYFINSKNHFVHAEFYDAIDLDLPSVSIVSGEIVFNPNAILPNGVIGDFSFNYSFGISYDFEHTRRTFELLAANMPVLQNNFNHFIGQVGEGSYNSIYRDDYIGSRVKVILESEFFTDVDYLPFNQAEGFGFFKVVGLDEVPGSRDIVLYDALPNSLPRVGGIITSVVQTPLSHVNLRAIQDQVPNAYIKNPLEIDSISSLLGKYIYYRAGQDGYEIREATLDEVNDWFENLRPTNDQIPQRDLTQTEILPLDEIEFDMSNKFGAKCSNVATMRRFGFPDGTIPNGYGVPFYFYDEFMKYNGFYEKAQEMISEGDFILDIDTRTERLKDFRKEIKDADMPQWMLDELDEMHKSFPTGTAVRCRSSTNNEDLPGFSGAGLYTSKTQHLDEGHISKSIKQVYASMWNFRAYEERNFYRVDHFIAAMGVLCHPNYENEKSNGVGVSIDPIYQTQNNFYLNTQVGEDLITNPDVNSIPEEILLSSDPAEGFVVLRTSNLIMNQLVMEEKHLNELRDYLNVIHDEFSILYNLVGAEGFGMDIEYKVTVDDQLIIKQARPWVSFWSEFNAEYDLAIAEITDPEDSSTLGNSELITASVANLGLQEMTDFSISLLIEDEVVETIEVNDTLTPAQSIDYQFATAQDFSVIGDYNVGVLVTQLQDGYSKNDTLYRVIRKLHALEAGILSINGSVFCDESLTVTGTLTNLGDELLDQITIEVTVNSSIVDTFLYQRPLSSGMVVNVEIPINASLVAEDNIVELRIISLNGQPDVEPSNNSASLSISAENNLEEVTLVVNPDDFPRENQWLITNINTSEIVSSGIFESSTFTVPLCLSSEACYNLSISDSAEDGICCDFGIGNFHMLNGQGDTLIYNNGQFGSMFSEDFCLRNDALSTDEADKDLTILYPNPTNGKFTIKFDESISPISNSSVEVFDYLGRVIDTKTIKNERLSSMSFTLEDEPSGHYFVKWFDGSRVRDYKVIKI